jgi:hypothetical protein
MDNKLKNKAASALHMMTAGLAMLNAGITAADALIDEARETGAPAETMDPIDKSLEMLSVKAKSAQDAKTAFHERVTRELDGTVLKIGT